MSEPTREEKKWTMYRGDHTAVVMRVLADGRVAVSRAYLSRKDQFVRKVGHAIAHARFDGLIKVFEQTGKDRYVPHDRQVRTATGKLVTIKKEKPIFEVTSPEHLHPEELTFFRDKIQKRLEEAGL